MPLSIGAGMPFNTAIVQQLMHDLQCMQVYQLGRTSKEQLRPSVELLHLQVVFYPLREQHHGKTQEHMSVRHQC